MLLPSQFTGDDKRSVTIPRKPTPQGMRSYVVASCTTYPVVRPVFVRIWADAFSDGRKYPFKTAAELPIKWLAAQRNIPKPVSLTMDSLFGFEEIGLYMHALWFRLLTSCLTLNPPFPHKSVLLLL